MPKTTHSQHLAASLVNVAIMCNGQTNLMAELGCRLMLTELVLLQAVVIPDH